MQTMRSFLYQASMKLAAKCKTNEDLETEFKDVANAFLIMMLAEKQDNNMLQRFAKFIEAETPVEAKELDSKVYSMFPLANEDEDDWRFYCAQETQFWTAKELDFAIDKQEYPKLKPRYQQLYKDCLGFFSPGDGLITSSALRLLNEAKRYTSQIFLIFQMAIETVHAEAYGLAITSIIPDPEEQRQVFEMVDKLDCVSGKAKFIKDLITSNAPENERMLAAACSEGIFFVTLFAIIFYLRSKSVMKTFIFLNKQVAADETLHRDYYTNKVRKLGCPDNAVPIVQQAVEIEIEHMKYILREPVDSQEEDTIMGLTIENLSNYARNLGDRILVDSGAAPYYNVKIDLPWMNDMSTEKRGNFYEVKVGGYKRTNLNDALNWEKRLDAITDDINPVVNPEDVDF